MRLLTQVVCYNGATYKYNVESKAWLLYTWGWWGELPSWKWIKINDATVPEMVKGV